MSLTKEGKGLYTKNYKTLIKDIKEARNKWKDFHVRGLEDLILLMLILPKAIYTFHTIPIEIPMSLFIEMEKNPKIHMESQRTLSNQNNLKK